MSQFSPDGASLQQRQSFQTELLELMMDIIHMLSHEEENNTHLNSQGRITMHGFLIAQTGLNMSMQKILSSEWMTFFFFSQIQIRGLKDRWAR